MLRGFIVENFLEECVDFDCEDFFKINKKKKIIAVADGVTRDWSLDLAKEDIPFCYPNPSPAKKAAEIFCNVFVESLEKCKKVNVSEIKKGFEKANKQIKKWNNKAFQRIDYLINDFAGTVASGVVIQKNKLFFGFVSDCGVAVFGKNGVLKFRTEDQGPTKFDKFFCRDKRIKGKNWSEPKVRKIIRRFYRNNPKERNSFGVLTGENSAIHYVRVGEVDLTKGDIILVYSDGVEKIVFSDEFYNLLKKKNFKRIKELCQEKVETEGTLVVYWN